MVVCTLAFISFVTFLFLLILKKLFWVSKASCLRNKHVVITGGSSGIGKSTAIEAAKIGANVTIIARDKTKLEDAVKEIQTAAKRPGEQIIQYLACDVTANLNSVGEVITNAEESAGPVDVFVNCVGMAVCGEVETASEFDFRHVMDVNYFGTILPTLCVAKRMKSRQKGHIVITGSQASLLGIYGLTAYSASKFAIRGFAESLFMELRPHNVSVTLFLPPETNTPGFAAENKSKPEITKLIAETPELFEPEDVALRLLSDALSKKFLSSMGVEGLVTSMLGAGMAPVDCWTDLCLQISLMGLLRFVFAGYSCRIRRIIARKVKDKNQ